MLSTLQTHSGKKSVPQRTSSPNRDTGEAEFNAQSEESAGSMQHTASAPWFYFTDMMSGMTAEKKS